MAVVLVIVVVPAPGLAGLPMSKVVPLSKADGSYVPSASVVPLPPFGLTRIFEAVPEVMVTLPSVWLVAPLLFPVMARVPPPNVGMTALLSRLVGVARLAKSSASVPPVRISVPVNVFTAEPLRVSVPAPDLVRPALPASTDAVLLPMVAVMPEPVVRVGVVPLRVRVLAPDRV